MEQLFHEVARGSVGIRSRWQLDLCSDYLLGIEADIDRRNRPEGARHQRGANDEDECGRQLEHDDRPSQESLAAAPTAARGSGRERRCKGRAAGDNRRHQAKEHAGDYSNCECEYQNRSVDCDPFGIGYRAGTDANEVAYRRGGEREPEDRSA